jgi:hypothetical protein
MVRHDPGSFERTDLFAFFASCLLSIVTQPDRRPSNEREGRQWLMSRSGGLTVAERTAGRFVCHGFAAVLDGGWNVAMLRQR